MLANVADQVLVKGFAMLSRTWLPQTLIQHKAVGDVEQLRRRPD